ncbi:manganese transport protein [Catalinimonas alkaloidigena]|uniref:Nramp family divalent metal transporter n=1 Tax=Catalinimonas alkaloidigena TaxID=1075417 RepID=UPI002404BC82|nr:Nramp family divalent metal transporter [Catalinimonas alkaloidigena]MDF9797574.1 manganese transport protein [Catalinimonas alkaloidigena]
MKHKILLALSAIGPGLFLIGYNIGTGSVTTMAKAGAEYGMTLFWALILSCLFTYILMVAYGQLTLVSGKTALFNIKTEIKGGKLLALYIMTTLIIGEMLALIGIMGIVAELVQEGIRLLTNGFLLDTSWIIMIFVLLLYLLLWFGRYKIFERILTIFVILMALCFMMVFFMVKPSFPSILAGIVPGIPDTPGAFGLVAAMAGTTCSAAVFIMRSTVVAEKGWTIQHLKSEKRDAFVSALMMLFLSGIIMAVSAGTLHLMGLKLDNTLEMISLFEPLGGKLAAFLLILGIVGAGLSTVFPIVLIAPWLISDFSGRPRNIRSPMFRILILLGLLFAFGSIFMDQSPPLLLIFSQAFQAAILPAVAIPVFILLNKKNVMVQNLASHKMNLGLAAVIIFAFITTYFAIIDFF